MQVHGQCHCGAVSFTAKINPDEVLVCHCEDCQKLSGTSFRTVVPASSTDLVFSGETPKTYVKIGLSGARREQGFCGTCGSALYATSEGDGPKLYSLRVGVLAEKAQLAPKHQKFLRSAMPWLDTLPTLPGTQT
ncbi:MAG: GFA family protein [Cohaesibacter sp.]|jgi:hypothetical protein|nr:GFA family protein [Cohaesibacter sp.]